MHLSEAWEGVESSVGMAIARPRGPGNNSYKRCHDSAPTRLLKPARVKGSAAGEWPPILWEGITMIRAIVGTVAVLAGFAVLERSVDASTGQAGSCTPTEAYALLLRGEAVPVRTDPTPQAAVIGTLSGRRGGTTNPARAAVTITGSPNGLARIALATAHDYSAARTARPHGWAPADRLAVDAGGEVADPVQARPGRVGHGRTSSHADQMDR